MIIPMLILAVTPEPYAASIPLMPLMNTARSNLGTKQTDAALIGSDPKEPLLLHLVGLRAD